jgi:hypothetical protein
MLRGTAASALALTALLLGAVALNGSDASAAEGSFEVEPHVGLPGSAVTVTGQCTETVRLTVKRGATGWYDMPATLVNVSIEPQSGGGWQYAFSMPSTPATVVARCGDGFGPPAVLIAPDSDALPTVQSIPDGEQFVVLLDNLVMTDQLRAYTPAGEPVPATAARIDFNTIEVGVSPPDLVSSVIIVGWITFGENADANQISSVAAWRATLPGTLIRWPAQVDTPAVRGRRTEIP